MTEKPAPNTPGSVELYILAAGLLLGVLAGPAVLGRIAPTAHASLFGGGPATQQLTEYDEETAAMVAALEATGVTPAAVDEQIELRSLQRDAIRQARDAVMDRNAMIKLVTVLVLLTAAMLVEAAAGRGGRAWGAVRYAVAGAGLALILARPGLIVAIPSAWLG